MYLQALILVLCMFGMVYQSPLDAVPEPVHNAEVAEVMVYDRAKGEVLEPLIPRQEVIVSTPKAEWVLDAVRNVETRLPWVEIFVRVNPQPACTSDGAWLRGYVSGYDAADGRLKVAVTLYAVPDSPVRRWTQDLTAAVVAHEVGHVIWFMATPDARAGYVNARQGHQEDAQGREDVIAEFYPEADHLEEYFADDFAAWVADPSLLPPDLTAALEAIVGSAVEASNQDK